MLSCGNQVPNSHQAMPHSLRFKTLLPSTVSLLEGLTVQFSTRMQRWDTAKPSAAMLKVVCRTGVQHWFCAITQLWPGTGSRTQTTGIQVWAVKLWFLQDGLWSVFSSNQPLKSCWFGQVLLNIQRLSVWRTHFWWLELQCRLGNACSVHQQERWGGKGTVCMNAEQFLPWLCPAQSYQAGNSASPSVCSSLGRCNQEEMKVPKVTSRTILPLHRLLAFTNEANSRTSPWIRSSAKTTTLCPTPWR